MARSFKANTTVALAIYGLLWIVVFTAWCYFYEKVPASSLEPGKHYLLEKQEVTQDGHEVQLVRGTKITPEIKAALVSARGENFKVPVTGNGDVVTFDFTLVFQIMNFLLMIWILHGLLWKPMMALLDARAAKIRGDLENAKASHEEAERMRRDYEKKLEDAKHERARIVIEGRNAGQEERSRIVKEAEEDAERIIERARKQGEEETAEALEKLKSYVVELGVSIAAKILQKEIRDEDHRKMAETLIAELEQGQKPA